MQDRLNYWIRPEKFENAPLPIKQGASFYSIPHETIHVYSIVYDIDDITKSPRVVVSMPYWTRTFSHTGIEEVRFYKGVNVIDLHGGNPNNMLSIERYALLENPPSIPQDTIDWISDYINY